MPSNLKTFFIVLLLSLSVMSFGHKALAVGTAPTTYNLLAPIPLDTPSGATNLYTTPAQYVKGIVNLMIAAAGVFAVLRLITAGLQYIAVDSFSGKDTAKKEITNAVIGLVLAIGAFTILQTISTQFTKLTIGIQTVGSTTSVTNPGVIYRTSSQQSCTGNIVDGKCYDVSSSTPKCPNCEPMPDNNVVPQKAPQPDGQGCLGPGPCMVNADLIPKLIDIQSLMQQQQLQFMWQVTEMYPPTVPHNDACHVHGSCVDFKLFDTSIPMLIKVFTILDTVFPDKYEYELPCGSNRLTDLQSDPKLAKWKNKIKCETTTTAESGHLEL